MKIDEFQCLLCNKLESLDNRGSVRGEPINICEDCIERMSNAITKANVKEEV